MNTEEDICCPLLDKTRWDEITHEWKDKPFVKDSLPTFFHIPFPPMIGRKIKRMMDKIEASGQCEENKEDTLVLFRDPTAFRSEIYISVKGQVKDADNAPLSGRFVSKVFAGGYNSAPTHVKAMNAYLKSRGLAMQDLYIHYAYCPKCAKKYGENSMVLFARV